MSRNRFSDLWTPARLGFGNPFGLARIVGKRMRPITWSKPHQGAQEIARRARQIRRWQLTVSNGLVQS